MKLRKISIFGLGLLVLVACDGGQSPGGNTANSSMNNSSPNATASESIPVTRDTCTPFGNLPRPRNDELNDTNSLSCSGGGSRLPDWVDPQGTTRAACIYQPEPVRSHKLPLIFWLQGSAVPGETQLDLTNLLDDLDTANLSNDSQRPGFILIELAGRVTDHFYPAPNDTRTIGWDVWDRQLEPEVAVRAVNSAEFAQNLDAAAIDHYIAEVVASGAVDENRIYMMGWSNGAGMAINYAMNRPEVASAAVYSAPNPFDALTDPCGQVPTLSAARDDREVQVFNAAVPIFHIINHCDIYSICPSGVALDDTLRATGTANMRFEIIGDDQTSVAACLDICGTNPRGAASSNPNDSTARAVAIYGTGLHLRWPRNRTADFFEFLKNNPLAR